MRQPDITQAAVAALNAFRGDAGHHPACDIDAMASALTARTLEDAATVFHGDDSWRRWPSAETRNHMLARMAAAGRAAYGLSVRRWQTSQESRGGTPMPPGMVLGLWSLDVHPCAGCGTVTLCMRWPALAVWLCEPVCHKSQRSGRLAGRRGPGDYLPGAR